MFGERQTKRIYPGMILFRSCEHLHRVELIKNKPAFTLVFTGRYVRQWGFILKNLKWQQWNDYFTDNGC
jgi:hypothetical protein